MGEATGIRRLARRLRARVGPTARPPAAKKPAKGACRVCHGERIRRHTVSNERFARQLKVRICRDCGFVGIPGNVRDYKQYTSVEQLGSAPRVGTEETPGREYAMARLALAAVGGRDLSVLVYGAGRGLDNQHISTLKRVNRVAIGDVFRAREDAEFVDITRPATQQWDVVIASEVVEHFVNPRREFGRLFGYVADDGLLICSTNLHDGGTLAKQTYIFAPGHVAYYSPEALRLIARLHGFQVDFRVPRPAEARMGRPTRKRYLLFSRSAQVMERASDYFGRHSYAPSEWDNPRAPARADELDRSDMYPLAAGD